MKLTPTPAPGHWRFTPDGGLIDANSRIYRIRPGVGTPVNAAAATATLDPAGGNNSIAFAAKTPGAAGNSIRVGLALDATTDTTSLRATQAGNDVLVTSGGRVSLGVSITGGALAGSYTLTRDGTENDWPRWSLDAGGISASCRATATEGGLPVWRLEVSDGSSTESQDADDPTLWPDDQITWTGDEGEAESIQLAHGYATAAAVISLVNATESLLVTASASGASTGFVAAVPLTYLAGGIDITPGEPGDLLADEAGLYLRRADAWQSTPYPS
jgi:hypothetical protein